MKRKSIISSLAKIPISIHGAVRTGAMFTVFTPYLHELSWGLAIVGAH